MKAVPSVLHYLGKCTTGFSLNCVNTLPNSVTNEGAPHIVISAYLFFPGIVHRPCQIMKTVHLFVRKGNMVGDWLHSLSYAKLDYRQ